MGFLWVLFQGPLPPQKTANTAEERHTRGRERTRVNLAIDTHWSPRSIQQDGDLKGITTDWRYSELLFLDFRWIKRTQILYPGTAVWHSLVTLENDPCVPQSVLGLKNLSACDFAEGQAWVHPGLGVFAPGLHLNPLPSYLYLQCNISSKWCCKRLTWVVIWDFPGDPLAKMPCSQCSGPQFDLVGN